jgi:hypothetical protein
VCRWAGFLDENPLCFANDDGVWGCHPPPWRLRWSTLAVVPLPLVPAGVLGLFVLHVSFTLVCLVVGWCYHSCLLGSGRFAAISLLGRMLCRHLLGWMLCRRCRVDLPLWQMLYC